MSLPVVIIFERHWDTIPRSVIKDVLPDLSKRGYQTFCLEVPQNLSSAEILDRHNLGLELDSEIVQQAQQLLKQVGITKKLSDVSFSNLAELLRLYVSSKRYVEVAEKIKQLPASCILKGVFEEVKKLSMSLKGIDIDSENFDKIASLPISKKMAGIKEAEDQRITTLFQNLLKLRTEQEGGIIFTCGVLHAKGLIDAFKKSGLQNEVLYYFPHSSSRYEERIDDINEIAMNDTLLDHTYLLAQKDIKPFNEKIIREITEKTRYKKEILEYNSHSQFLSEYFKTNFRAFLRPGYHVDALVDIAEPSDREDIRRCVTSVGIQTYDISLNDRSYLVVPNVNTRDIGEKIRKIPSISII